MTSNAHPADPGPLPPTPPVPTPPPQVTTFWNAVKVFVITTLGIALKYAWSTNTHFADWSKIASLDNWHEILKVTFNGFLFGLIPGAVLGLMVLLAAWAGPRLWDWLGPVIVLAAQGTMKFFRGITLAFRGLPENWTPPAPRPRRKASDTTGTEHKG